MDTFKETLYGNDISGIAAFILMINALIFPKSHVVFINVLLPDNIVDFVIFTIY